MNYKKIKEILNTVAIWTTIIGTIFFALVWVKGEYYDDKNPQIVYKVLACSPVVDINEETSLVKILVNDVDIKEQNKMISVVKVRVINDSTKHLKIDDYDELNPLELCVYNGTIIDPEVGDVSDEYVMNLFKEVLQFKIIFNKIMLDAGDYFDVKFLVLHDADVVPEIQGEGHIAGMEKIEIQNTLIEKKYNQKIHRLMPFLGIVLLSGLTILLVSIARNRILTREIELIKMHELEMRSARDVSKELTAKLDQVLNIKNSFFQNSVIPVPLAKINPPDLNNKT